MSLFLCVQLWAYLSNKIKYWAYLTNKIQLPSLKRTGRIERIDPIRSSIEYLTNKIQMPS
jgi:hypothetical protein